eukprot:gene1898-2155_t
MPNSDREDNLRVYCPYKCFPYSEGLITCRSLFEVNTTAMNVRDNLPMVELQLKRKSNNQAEPSRLKKTRHKGNPSTSEKSEVVTDNKDEGAGVSDFEAVIKFTREGIINRSQAVSIRALHKIYSIGFGHENEKVYQNKLKARIVNEFGEKIKFLKIDGVTPEVVVSTAGLDATTICRDKDAVLKEAAEYIREDILEYSSRNQNTTWPPTVQSLKEGAKDSPSSLNDFLTHVLKSKDHKCSDKVKRLVSLCGYDLIHRVTRGKIVTLKNFLFGVGLHNITSLKLPIKVLSHLGHSINYDFVCEIETAEAEVAQMFYEKETDNRAEDSTTNLPNFTFCKRRSLESSNRSLPSMNIGKKKESKVASVPVLDDTVLQIQEAVDSFHTFYFIWMLSGHLSSSNQIIPSMSGWSVKIQEIFEEAFQKTNLTYLPPIDSPITEFSTMAKVFVEERPPFRDVEEYFKTLVKDKRKKRDVNAVRYEIFKNGYENKGKVQDLSLLPQCRQPLQLHCQRSSYISKVWRSCLQANIDFADIERKGWSADRKIVWVDAAFPEEVEQILAGVENNDESSIDGEDKECSDSDKDSL